MRTCNVIKADMKFFVAIALFAGLLPTELAQAHPMGNLSVNHYIRLEPGRNGVSATYVLDLAEIPTFELLQTWGLSRDAARDVLEAKAREQAALAARRAVTTQSNARARDPQGGAQRRVPLRQRAEIQALLWRSLGGKQLMTSTTPGLAPLLLVRVRIDLLNLRPTLR